MECRGPKGHNVEYVLKLAEWIREVLPEVEDDHLFSIEKFIRAKVIERGLCLPSLMGDEDHELEDVAFAEDSSDEDAEGAERKKSKKSAFSTQVGHKCMRCVKA